MEVEFDEATIVSGTTLTGRVTATVHDRITVKLEAAEASFPKPVTFATSEARADTA